MGRSVEEDAAATPRSIRPGPFTAAFNRLVAFLTRLGLGIYGSRLLAVRGRASGKQRATPVNLLAHDSALPGRAARGHAVGAQHPRRRRRRAAAGAGPRADPRRRAGRRGEAGGAARPPAAVALRGGRLLPGGGLAPSEKELRRIAADYPAFRIVPER
jgi:hypothetical protein